MDTLMSGLASTGNLRICMRYEDELQDGRLLRRRREDMSMAADSREYGGGSRKRNVSTMCCWKSSTRGEGTPSGSRVKRPKCWQTTHFSNPLTFLLLITSLLLAPAAAVFVEFQNCLSDSVQNNDQLQLVPLFVGASFNTVNSTSSSTTTQKAHQLNVTVWGNVTGSSVGNTGYATESGGKILNNPDPEGANKFTTLANTIDVLTYEPWNDLSPFCNSTTNGTCPLGPSFNASEYWEFPSFGLSNDFYSTYAFTSFSATLVIKYGDADATPIGCISAVLTPDLGVNLSSIVTYIPVVILVLVGIATAFAAIWSPWGTSDTFRWTTNYGRDADLLRLVTPGFGDCLQYIQFVALTGGLTLNYPGFYQPVVSKVSWSALMFNQSFVSNGTSESLQDGIYITNGAYGMDRLRQLVGMGSVDDVWAGMVIWLLVIIAAVLTLIQLGFFVRWAYRHINNTQEEDLRAKNMPFSVGNVIRVVFNYFLLPIVALSMFQLVVASQSPIYTVALAVVTLVLIIVFAVWLLYVIASTRPKSFLFDDLPTVLIYGSLYNTYSDDAAPFALIPILLTFIRGVAIGAVQPSGIAQLVLLAICEVITILTIHAFRPFHSPTSMNVYHTFFAMLKFATVLLMISFAPSLGVTEGPKGWIGYAILLMHAIVLILGFFLNALQTIVEVGARLTGVGEDGGTARGGLVKAFGMRQLSRRLPRHSRQSQLSNAAMLDANDRKSYIMDSGRMRSQSAGSTGILLSHGRQSMGMDSSSIDAYGAIPAHQLGSGRSSHTPTTPGEASTFSFLPSAAAPSSQTRNKGSITLGAAESADPYYRAPRYRRPTLETYSPGAQSRASWASSGNWGKSPPHSAQPEPASPPEQVDEGPSISGRVTPVLATTTLDGPSGSPNDPRRTNVDYTSREVDFYYGVRGPALNDKQPSRRIKTGPADPTGPAASAAGWFKGLFGSKTKEKGKGFEVVRSSRMPPGMKAANLRNAPEEDSPPEGIPVATGGMRNGPIDSDDEDSRAGPSTAKAVQPTPPSVSENQNLVSPLDSSDEESGDEDFNTTRISDVPTDLSGLEIPGGGIELPSRFPSKATSRAESRRYPPDSMANMSRMPSHKPNVPRKSSKRNSLSVDLTDPSARYRRQHSAQTSVDSSPSRLPFESGHSRKGHSDMSSRGTEEYDLSHSRDVSTGSALGRHSADVRDDRPTSLGYVHQHSIRTVNQNENPRFLGSQAEVVDAGTGDRGGSVEGPRRES